MVELRLQCPQDQVEVISDALMALDALSVSVEDADAHTDQEQALFGEPGMPPPAAGWLRSQVVALFGNEAAALDAAQLLSLQHFFAGSSLLGLHTVEEQDWVRLTQSQFEPIPISERMWVVPSWHQQPDNLPVGSICLAVDPGLAFGTGSHPTTKLCLQWLEMLSDADQLRHANVLDYGCGSGILAIAAKKLDAAHVVGIDIDPQAVLAGHQNALQNQVDIEFTLPDHSQDDQTFGIVVANILANPLQVLAPAICGFLHVGSRLALSGILERQADDVIATYAPWIKLTISDHSEGWVLLTGQR
jgi:ribosomal protein L11 methyltransferase